jgi:uncharacterized protein
MTAVSLFTYAELYDRVLNSLSHLLDKGEAYAAEQGQSPEQMLDWRLVEDMNPLRFQVMVVCNFTRNWTARAIGQTPTDGIESDLDMAGFRKAIADSRAYLAALTPADFEGRDDVPFTFKLGDIMEPTLPSGQWLTVFASTNVYFHLSMAYAILRLHGVSIGKPDLFAGRL